MPLLPGLNLGGNPSAAGMAGAALSPLQACVDMAHARLLIVAILAGICFFGLAVRLIDVSVWHSVEESDSSAAGEAGTGRADIVDRNGTPLASSLPTVSLYADPAQVLNPGEAATKLATVLKDIDKPRLMEDMKSRRRFVWVRRHLTPRQYEAINALGIPGLFFQKDSRRVYPSGTLAAHVLGYTGIDDDGLSGVEKGMDHDLRTRTTALPLALDLRIQHILREELSSAMNQFHALGAAGVVMDVNTGEVLGMVSLPDFDPNAPESASDNARFNRASLGVYEMGSTFKTFTIAAALDRGIIKMADRFDATKAITSGRFRISDFHPENRWLTVPEIYLHSSNIGAARIGLKLGAEAMSQFLTDLRLLNALDLELPESGVPMVPRQWKDLTLMTVSFGHGIAVTALQLCAAISAVVNGGTYHSPTLLKLDHPPMAERVISSKVSNQMRKLMRLVVTEGTAKAANAAGYVVGGKTGTAEKLGVGGYNKNARLSSFVGIFPAHAPRYVVFAMLDEPKGIKETAGFATGGWVAAPMAGRVVSRVAPLMGIVPVADDDAVVKEMLAIDPALYQDSRHE
ncbi:MAG: penicillin-binding protein 2 [Alphaproteobacteria bacterium]|nr:MAG: penicillin-binding protein 2 [Alphaproteobacteria bacterium]